MVERGAFGELDDIGFLREAELFKGMPESVIRTIMLHAPTLRFSAGEWVVHQGDPGASLFVVKSGVVEVVGQTEDGGRHPLAYLGRGECLGELAILTNTPRTADVRVPEHCELVVIEKDLFNDLLANHPGFGSQLAVILAHRLVKMLQNLPSGGGSKELQGSLRYFDLATVIQTLITSGQSGSMTLTDSGETVSRLFFQDGNIARAEFGHRTGDEAVHQLFQTQLACEFLFASSEKLPPEADIGITAPAMALMLESVRLQDELKLLIERLPPLATVLERADSELRWPDADGRRQAQEIWEQTRNPTTVAAILDGSPSCHFHTASILVRLIEAEQLMPALAEGPS